MNTHDILTIYDYNYWATRQILVACAHVSPEQYITLTVHSFGSLRGTLVHTLDSELGWRMLLQHNTLSSFRTVREEDFPTLDSLEQSWREEERAMREYLASLSDNDLSNIVRYTTDERDKRARVLWHCLLHVVNHGTQHRTEAAAMLTDLGFSPGDIDLIYFLD